MGPLYPVATAIARFWIWFFFERVEVRTRSAGQAAREQKALSKQLTTARMPVQEAAALGEQGAREQRRP